jgi:hypothetical protein
VLKKLVKFADCLDSKNLFEEANHIDIILQRFASLEDNISIEEKLEKINQIIREEASSIMKHKELGEAVRDAFEGMQMGNAEAFSEMMMEKALSLYLKLADEKLVKDIREVSVDEDGREITTYKDEARVVSDTGIELASYLIEKSESEGLENYIEFFKEIKERFEEYGPEKSNYDFGTLEDYII